MMKYIYNDKTLVGELRIPEGEKPCAFIYGNISRKDVPFRFSVLWEKESGLHVDYELLMDWINDRVIPCNRMNISEILDKAGMTEYDELELFLKLNGRHNNDKVYLA